MRQFGAYSCATFNGCHIVLQIKALSPPGGAQLAADAEYFCNVMSALAVAPPAGLITAQLFAAAPADAFGQLAGGAVAGGSADVKVGAFDYNCFFKEK
jgi:hypothetical protein